MAIAAGARFGHHCILPPLGFSTRGRLFEMKMDMQHWQQIETLYHAALERAPDERAAFLADACAEYSDLLREVEEFLRRDGMAESFMQHNALAPLIALPFLSLTAGDISGLLCFKPRSIPK